MGGFSNSQPKLWFLPSSVLRSHFEEFGPCFFNVSGILARQRKVELEKINAQLRQINVNLRRQSRLETYAPNLTYAPVGGGRMADLQVHSVSRRRFDQADRISSSVTHQTQLSLVGLVLEIFR